MEGLLLKEILDGLVGNHLLVECVAALLGLDHLDDLGVAAAIGLTGLQGSDCFLCHCTSALKGYYLISL